MCPRNGFPESHPLFGGFLPAMRDKIVARLTGHDFVLVLGAPAFSYHVEGEGPHVPPGTRLAQIVDDPQQAAWAPVGTAVVASVDLAAQALLAYAPQCAREHPAPRAAVAPAQAGVPMSTAFALQTLDAVRAADTIVVEEAVSYTHLTLPTKA